MEVGEDVAKDVGLFEVNEDFVGPIHVFASSRVGLGDDLVHLEVFAILADTSNEVAREAVVDDVVDGRGEDGIRIQDMSLSFS
jgi:hypothetical protein